MSPDAPLLLNVRGGSRICVPPAIANLTTYVVLEQEDWFEDEIAFVRRWLRPGMHAVDAGANLGLYTLAMAQAVGRRGSVWALEPARYTAQLLRRTLELNGCAQAGVIEAAVIDRVGEVRFSNTARLEANAVAAAHAKEDEFVNVPAITLSRAAEQHDWHDVAFIKLDVEGQERAAIEGGKAFLSRQSPLVMFEIAAPQGTDLGMLPALSALGYAFYRLLPGQLLLEPFDERGAGTFQLNLFACKRDREDELAAEGVLAAAAAPAPLAPTASAAEHYREGLAQFDAARSLARSAAERRAALRRAYKCVGRALQSEDTLPRRITFARLSWEMGVRGAAVVSLAKALGRLKAQAPELGREPFLAPSPRAEALACRLEPAEWLECALVEQYERLREFSSYFAGASSLSVLAPIEDSPYQSPEMERRRRLVRTMTGLPAGPARLPLLCRRSEDNLNPEYWCT